MARAKRTRSKSSKTKKITSDMEQYVNYIEEGNTIEVSDNFLDYVFLLYGESGSGKTSILSKAPGAYIIQCDPNREGLAVRQTNIPNLSIEEMKRDRDHPTPWQIINATLEKIIEDDSVNTVIIDNLRFLYTHATNDYCLRNTVNSLNEMDDFGASWNNVDAMYLDWFSKIANAGKGLGIITHQDIKINKLADDSEFERIQPDVTGRPLKAMYAITNFAFYLHLDSNGKRVLCIRHPGNEIWTKCCLEETQPHFYDPDGEMVGTISMGNSPQQGWDNWMKSWNNELFDVNYKPPKENTKKRRTKRA